MKYLMQFPRQNASALFEFDQAGYLIAFSLTPGEFKEAQYDYLTATFPFTQKRMESWVKGIKVGQIPNVQLAVVPEDLSFDRFYMTYDMKFGKKSRSLKIWENMTDVERAKAISFIAQYNSHLLKTNISKLYPETYLNQKPWDN